MRLRLLILAVTLTATPAFAGFEFVSPAGPSAITPPPRPRVAAPAPAAPKLTAPPPAASAMPVVPNDPVNVAPLNTPPQEAQPKVIGTKAIPLTPVVKRSDALLIEEAVLPPPPSAKSVSALALPSPLASSSLKKPPAVLDDQWKMPKPVASAAAPSSNETPVEGFGRQVPLAMALQQIAPPGYRFTFDYGVDSGQRVNWTGGKPWEIIVADIARANNLNVDIVSKVIAFRRRSPLDIVVADGSVSRRADTVQGLKLKPVAGGFRPAIPTPVAAPVVAQPPVKAPAPIIEEEEIEVAAAMPQALPAPIVAPAPAPVPQADEAPMPITQPAEQVAAADDEPALGGFVYAGTPEPQIIEDSPFDLNAVAEWQGLRNMTLRDVLTEWAQLAGVSLVWQSDYDWPLQTDVRIQANFADSVRTLLAGFGKASPRPIGRLFRNKAAGMGAQPVLIVETQNLTR